MLQAQFERRHSRKIPCLDPFLHLYSLSIHPHILSSGAETPDLRTFPPPFAPPFVRRPKGLLPLVGFFFFRMRGTCHPAGTAPNSLARPYGSRGRRSL